MRLLLLQLLLATLVLLAAGAENGTKSTRPVRKTLRMVKGLKKSSKIKASAKKLKSEEQVKSESYHVPVIVSSEDMSHEHIPVNIELHDDDRYLKSAADLHPIEPIHVVPLENHYQQSPAIYVETQQPRYSYPSDSSQSEDVYHGPVAIPRDYPEGYESDHYIQNSGIAPQEYYPDNYGDLSAIPGSPGVDYPSYSYLPTTGFECLEHTSTPGFYADVETKCQMWHYCQPDGRHDRFLCPNGTVFDQLTRVCNWWYNVHCENSLSFYDINFDLYREPVKKTISQSLDVAPYSHQSSSPSYVQSVGSIPKANSFLSHVQDFESELGSHPQSFGDYNYYGGDDSYTRPIQAAANHQVHRYPAKRAPAPRVQHDYESSGTIDSDSSNSHALSAPREEVRRTAVDSDSHKPIQKKRVARRKLRKHPKIYSKHADDNIPTYREGKATPTASRRYRVVRRRKIHKD